MDFLTIFFACFAIIVALGIGAIAREFGAFKKCSRPRKNTCILPVIAPSFTTLRPPTPSLPEPTPIEEAKIALQKM